MLEMPGIDRGEGARVRRDRNTCGARLTRPRDPKMLYVVGRLGVVTWRDCWRLGYGSAGRARLGFHRLVKLGFLRAFKRPSRSAPQWYGLTATGRELVLAEFGCDETEVRAPTGIARMNLVALQALNRVWVSIVLACQRRTDVTLVRFIPEATLRRMKAENVGVVPDGIVVLAPVPAGQGEAMAWMIEVDLGSERRAVWEAKAKEYRRQRERPSFYGALRWNVLTIVPSQRRAKSVAQAIHLGGASAFTFIGRLDDFVEGRGLEPALWRTDELVSDVVPQGRWSIMPAAGTPDPQPRSTVDRGLSDKTREGA